MRHMKYRLTPLLYKWKAQFIIKVNYDQIVSRYRSHMRISEILLGSEALLAIKLYNLRKKRQSE